ncbi:unnamed protein product [Schistosoma intercalatum]|nr:unnamed protein product [Schistosoma intercalatum]
MGNETSQTSGQEEDNHRNDVSHKRSQSLQRDLTLSDTGITLLSNSCKSQSQISLHEIVGINDSNQDKTNSKLTTDTSTTEIALLKTVQMELTDDEKECIQQVLARARLVEMNEDKRVTKLQTELKHTEQVVKRRVSLSNQDVTKQVYCCLLCGQTPLPEGQYSEQDWKVCHDCQNTLCPNCVVQIGKNVDSEVFWLCKLCQKKRQLTVSSGSWLQRLPKNNNNKQTKELQKLIQKTHGITRTASYSQYEDLIDQVSLDESTVNSGDQDEHEGEEEKEEEWKQLIQKDNTQLVKSHENSILKNIHQRRASEQNNIKEVVKSTHRLYHSINDNQPVNNETRKVSMGQKFLRQNDGVIHDEDDDVDRDNYKNRTYQNRLHLYFTKQISEQFSVDSDDDDHDDDNADEKDNQKSDLANFHDKSNESNQNDQLNETILHNKKSSTIVQQLHHEECYDGIDMTDKIQKITPTDVIDEKATERKEIVQSTYTNVLLDNSDQINVSWCTVSPINILSHHHTDKQQFIPEEYTISSMNYLNTSYHDNQEHLSRSNSDQIILNDQENIIESFNSYSINQKNDPFNENSLIYLNRQPSIKQDSKNDISMKYLEKRTLFNTYTQSHEDKIGLIIPQYNSDEYNEDMNMINDNNNNETKSLSQSLLTNQDNGRYSNHIHLQCNNQSRRQSCPIIINDDHVLSLSNQMIQQQQQQQQRPRLALKSSYFEDVNTDDHDHDNDDDDDNEDRFIHSYYDQSNSYHSNRLSNHEMNSNHLNLFFPYNLNESWDYAEDLRKIDENIYHRTNNSNKTLDFTDITYNTINSSIFSENEIHTTISTGTTNVTSIGSYYIDDTIKSSIKNHDINYEPSMNDLYLNWLNELNSNYVSMNQQDNLLSTNYNVNKHEDYISECSLINNSSSLETSVSNYITTTTITDNSNTETNEQNHLLLKRCPNFENISRLSNNNNNDNNINSNIQLMEESSSFYEGLMKLSEIVNDEKEDLETNNDTPTKVWGREFRDRLQISDTSTCLPSNLFDDIKPELEIWSNLFNTSEIVVDTAREISTQLNLLSTLEEDDVKEERNEWEEKVEVNVGKQAENIKDNEENQTDHDQCDKNDKELVDSRSHMFITTHENDKLNTLKDNEITEDNEKHDNTSSDHFTTKLYITHIKDDTELHDLERISTQLETQIVAEENLMSQPYNYGKVYENNIRTDEETDHFVYSDTPTLTTTTTYKSNESNHNMISDQNMKLKCKNNQFPYTSLPIDKRIDISKQKEETFKNTKEDLYHSDILEFYEHVIPTINSPLSLDNSYSASIKSPNNIDEKNSIINEILYPYYPYEQQLTQSNSTYTYMNNKQYYPLIHLNKEGSHLELTNNHKDGLKKSNRKSNKNFLTNFFNENNDSLNYSIDQSNNSKNSSLILNNTLNIESENDQNKTIIEHYKTDQLSIINNPIEKSIEKSFNNNNNNNLITFSDTTQKLFNNTTNTTTTTTNTPTCIGIKQQSINNSLSLTKPFCCFNEKLLKRAQLILSNSPITNEPDPTDTLLALTEDNNNNNNNNQYKRSHQTSFCKSSIKNYFLSLSCPQSLSNQLFEDNYDTLSDGSEFSIHVPITNSILNENTFNESKLSLISNFKEFYANKHLWESIHSQWYIHILKRITDEAKLISIPEQTIYYDNLHTEYMSSSSSSRGSYFTNQRRRPHSSAYSYEVNSLVDDLPGTYESPNSSSSIIYSRHSYNHRSLHDVYPDRFIKSFNDDDNYRINLKPITKSNLKSSYDSRPYRSYSEAGTSHHYHPHHHHHHLREKDKTGLASIIRHDRRNKLGFIHHTSSRSKHFKSDDVESVLQQRILKDSNRNIKSTELDKSKDSVYSTRFNKNYQDYEISHRIKRGNLRSYTPTYKSFHTPQTKWSNDNSFLEVGSYFSLPLNDYGRKGIKHSRPTLTNQRYDPSSIEFLLQQKVPFDEWNKSDHLTRRIGNLSKSTGHLSHLDDLNKFSGSTSMQTLRARLAAAHSEFNLDYQENISDSYELQKLDSNKFGSLDRRTDSNDFTTRQLRQQVEQHHRRLLKSLMTDEPYESSWPSSFSNFDLQGYLNSYCDESEMRPTTLISSTLAPPIFSTASTRLPLSIEQGKIDETMVEPTNYTSTTDQQFLSVPNMLTTSNLNSTAPVVLPNQVPLTNNLANNIMNQPTSVSLNEQIPVSNNTLIELINNPDFIQALTYNPELINQINSMCLDLAPADLNQVTLAAVAGAIAATAVAGSGMLDNNTTTDNINNVITCQPTNEHIINSLLQNTIASDQMMNNYPNTGNFISTNNNTDLINNVSSINSTYLPNSHIVNDINSNNNIPRMNTLLPDGNSCVDTINPESIDILIEQVRKLLNEQNQCDMMNSTTTSINDTVINNNPINTTSSSIPFNNQLLSSLPSSIHQTNQSIMNEDKIQNPADIYYQKSLRHIHNQSVDEVNKQQYNKMPSETINNWLGLSDDEWNYKTYEDNTKNPDSWIDNNTTWPSFNPLTNHKSKSIIQPTKCTYDFPTKRLLLMRESKDRHQKGCGIGMRIVGGHIRSDGNLGAFVEEIYPSGPADQLHGEIKEGDEILEWNSIPLVGKTFEEVQAIISQVSEETELLVRADYTQGDDVDDEGEDDGEEIEDEDDEDEEYDEEYLDDDDDDEDATSLMKTCGSGSTGNSGQTNRTHALCHHHAAQHALMSQSKGPPICPHIRQHYLSMPSNDHRSMNQVAHSSHKLHSTNEQQIQEEDIEESRLTLNNNTMNWFESNSPKKSINQLSPSTVQDSKYTKQSNTSDSDKLNNSRRLSKGGRVNEPRGSRSSNNEKHDDTLEYGEIELILTFDDYDQSLTVHVARARNLPAMDLNGLADPFVKVRLHPDPTEDPDFNRQTKYMPNTLTPEWQQTVVFMNCIKRTLKRRVLEVTVWDFDRLKTNDFMGQTIINLGDKEYLDGKPHWFSLHGLMPVVIPVPKKSVSSSKTSSDSSRQAKSSKDSSSRRSTVNKSPKDQLQSQRINI